MEKIISKVYIITSSDDRFNKIKYRLGPKIKTIKCLPINDVPNRIEDITTNTCSSLCSNKTIKNWLSHYYLWKRIAAKKEENVLILEDTGFPIKSFESLLEEYWKEVPEKWDMIYFGCSGSCDSSLIKDATYRLFKSRENQDVYKNNKKMVYVMEPGFPLGLYGYMLSKSGVTKLANHKQFEKIRCDIDYYIANEIMDDDNFTVYAFNPPLVINRPHNKKITNHDVLKPIIKNIKLSKKQNINDLWNDEIYHIRFIGTSLTYMTVLLSLITLIVGYYANEDKKTLFIAVLTLFQIFEMAYTETNKHKLKNLIFELFIIYMFYYVGHYLSTR